MQTQRVCLFWATGSIGVECNIVFLLYHKPVDIFVACLVLVCAVCLRIVNEINVNG